MNSWELGYTIANCIRDEVTSHLGIETEWVGDPATSVFGIQIKLTWDGNPVRSTIVDFIGKTFD